MHACMHMLAKHSLGAMPAHLLTPRKPTQAGVSTLDGACVVSPDSSSLASEACSEVLTQVEPFSRVLCSKPTNPYTFFNCTLTNRSMWEGTGSKLCHPPR